MTRPSDTDSRVPILAFAGVVLAAAVVLVHENRHMWFGGDEWYVITDRGVTAGPGHRGALEPFNEHWTTLPILVFRALYALVGLHSYWPYVALVIIAHLAVVVLLWTLMRRAQVDSWVASSACAVFAVLGTGAENLLNAWQVTLVSSLAFGLAALVVAPVSGRLGWRDGAASVLLLASLASSGVGLPLVVVVAIVSFVRRGWRVAASTIAAPVVAYGAWYLAYGSDASVGDPTPDAAPRFVWDGVTDALGDVARLDLLGVVVTAGVLGWVVVSLRRRPLDRNLLVPGALALGAVVFLASTGWRRGELASVGPAISRYAYVTVALVLPLVAMASQGLFRGDVLRRGALVVVTVVLVVAQVRVLDRAAEVAEPGKRSDRGAMLATAALASEGRTFVYASPLHPFEPQVTVDEIVAMHDDGKLPPLDEATTRDRLTVLARLNLTLDPVGDAGAPPVASVALGPVRRVALDPTAATAPGCVVARDARPTNEIVLRPSGSSTVRLHGDGLLRMWLRDESRGVDGEPVVRLLEPGVEQVLGIADVDGSVVVSVPSGTTICGLR